MRSRDDLPEGVNICEACGELYPDETTLSEYCEYCEYEIEQGEDPITDAAIVNQNRLYDEMIKRTLRQETEE